MKQTFTLLTVLFFTLTIWAQSPSKMSYQAIIRDSDNNLIQNQTVGIQISIIQGSVDGTTVYTENLNPGTNINGLISIEFGGDTGFDQINWANGPYFIKTETDPTGGNNYTITSVAQLLSVPFALHAKTADSIAGNITETDPEFTAWDKSTGISITESQISDLQTYLSNEADPVFVTWNKSDGITITESQISDLKAYLTIEADGDVTNEIQDLELTGGTLKITNNLAATDINLAPFLGTNTDEQLLSFNTSTNELSIDNGNTVDLSILGGSETDPLFSAWNKSDGITITESQISDLQTYLTNEVDPSFTAWNKSDGITITESQISDLQTYLTNEADPSFTAWNKSDGITITESQISDLQAYLTNEADPSFTAWNKSDGITITESQISDLQAYLTNEADPSFTAWNKSDGITITESQISDLKSYLTIEVDGDETNEIQDLSEVITEGNDAGGNTIENLANPVNPQDAVTKAYVDKLENTVDALMWLLEDTDNRSIVKDEENNTYKAIKIGTQVWMTENLKTTKYNDGTPIPLVKDGPVWGNLTTPAYCWYENDSISYSAEYGALYNWYAIETGNLCPDGWHVPTGAEWTTLIDFIGGSLIAGAQLKETGTEHWNSPNTGATNLFGFTALPGGSRVNETFSGMGANGLWGKQDFLTDSEVILMFYLGEYVDYQNIDPKTGISIRCVKN